MKVMGSYSFAPSVPLRNGLLMGIFLKFEGANVGNCCKGFEDLRENRLRLRLRLRGFRFS
jgi:hypothetical protein